MSNKQTVTNNVFFSAPPPVTFNISSTSSSSQLRVYWDHSHFEEINQGFENYLVFYGKNNSNLKNITTKSNSTLIGDLESNENYQISMQTIYSLQSNRNIQSDVSDSKIGTTGKKKQNEHDQNLKRYFCYFLLCILSRIFSPFNLTLIIIVSKQAS